MEFRLTYRGRLPSDNKRGRTQIKDDIRMEFHKQLETLWDRPPLVDLRDILLDQNQTSHIIKSVGDDRYAVLVHSRNHMYAELHITFLCAGDVTGNITTGGDLDNRIKTLLDALRVPQPGEIPTDSERPSPCYCVLEDDRLVRSFAVTADELLDADNDREVLLLVHVVTKATRITGFTVGLI